MIDIIKFEGQRFDLCFTEIKNYRSFQIITASNEAAIRKAAENKSVDILIISTTEARDKVHSRDSGLNQVICKLMANNKIAIAFSFADLLNSKERHKLIGRWMQNIRLCRKFKVRMVLASFAANKWEMRAAKDLFSLALTLGMTGKEAQEALDFKKKEKEIKIV